MFVGRRTWSILRALGLERVTVDYLSRPMKLVMASRVAAR